jgi:hypothetical protein
MYLSGIGASNSSVAVPIVGSDRITTGYSPSTMHVDPVSGIPFEQEAAQAAVIVVQPASHGVSLWLIAALALGAWWAYRQGWFTSMEGA